MILLLELPAEGDYDMCWSCMKHKIVCDCGGNSGGNR